MQGMHAKFSFPQDDQFWVVKYIDQFNLAHARTRTASVQVMLQRLPIVSKQELSRLSPDATKQLLGTRPRAPKPEFDFVSVLAGQLPAIRIGDVFHNREKVGELPSLMRRLTLGAGETDSTEVRAGETIEPVPGWAPGLPYRILNAFEYSGVTDHFQPNVRFNRSRVVFFKRFRKEGGSDTYVLPRMTIFKAFYATHNLLANAFCSGPWSKEIEKVVSFNETYGGLQTGIADGGRQWNIVLQTLIPDEYAGLLAVLHFDDYARARAESIFAKALRDRGANPRAPWFASAEIPLQAKTGKLDLAVKCLQLRGWIEKTEDNRQLAHQKFLITDICGSNWPAHYPIIGHSRTNAGGGGAQSNPVASPKPYGGTPPSKEANEDTVIRADLDGHSGSSTTIVKGNQWSWLDAGPQYRRLEKEQSQRYQGGLPGIDNDGTEVSAGAHTFEKDALPKAEVKTVVRAPNACFDHMYQALCALAQRQVIANLTVIPARRPEQRSERSGYTCWTFIDDESLRRKLKPYGGFRTIYDIPHDRRSAHWRTALALRFEYGGRLHHWVEIERNRSNSFRSLLLTIDNQLDANDVIEAALNAIAEARGVAIDKAVQTIFQHVQMGIFAYTHFYNNDGTLREDLLESFLRRSVAV